MIKTFNTGRKYSPQGQRIAYTVLAVAGSEALVALVDVDRGINYVLDVQWPHGDREVMEAYDKGCISRGYWMPEPLRLALEDAAYPVESRLRINKRGEHLVIDGTAEDGTYQGDADAPPFVVFNVDRQQVVAGPFETVDHAKQALMALYNEVDAVSERYAK